MLWVKEFLCHNALQFLSLLICEILLAAYIRVWMSVDCSEAYIVFLDDRWVEAVEIQQENVLVIKSTLGVKH